MKPSLSPPGGRVVDIHLLNEQDPVKIVLDAKEITVEDACNIVARKLGISPLCKSLFLLKSKDTNDWLSLHVILQKIACSSFEYRLRYQVPNIKELKEWDLTAFEYFYHQVRRDVLYNNVRNLNYDRYEADILGLVVTDMYRVALEEKIAISDLKTRYKSFVPKMILKQHFLNVRIKNKLIATLNGVAKMPFNNVTYLKEEYLLHFIRNAPDYLVEEFTAQNDDSGVVRYVNLKVNPYDAEMPGIQFSFAGKNEWTHLSTIDDICFVSIRRDGTTEICRKNGIPVYYRFLTEGAMFSFVSLLDGYYRLSVKSNFNLCKEVYTPSLNRLRQIKCHGPVGGHFSYAKLQEKRENKKGSYLLRECEKSHWLIYLDVCVEGSQKPKTFRITVNPSGDFTFSYDEKVYPSIPDLVAAFKPGMDPKLELIECLPPAESDKSQMLICGSDTWINKKAANKNPEEMLLTAAPQCINIQTLQVFPDSKRETGSGKCWRFRARWKYSPQSRVDVAMKELKRELRDKFLSDFLELAGRWSSLQACGLVKLYGVTLTGKISMVTEYLPMGPLDKFLSSKNPNFVQQVDLVEAAASLAMALWQLEEAKLTHGNIRCSKILVASHDANSFKVKLGDPGLHTLTDADVPWIPPECYDNLAQAKSMTSADVWAFGTTLWEMFSFGKKPPVLDKSFYKEKKRLPQPVNCPVNIYKVMLECWDPDIYKRKTPQAIMRDIYHILYQVFNSRRVHSYATVYPRTFSSEDSQSLAESGGSLRSDATDETMLAIEVPTEDLIVVDGSITSESSMTDLSLSSDSGQLVIFREMGPYSTQATPDIASLPASYMATSYNTFAEETIFQLGKNCNVIIQGKIGQGHYGQVFKGLLEWTDHEPQTVAVKELKSDSLNAAFTLQDFKREIQIMQGLNHPNIVKIIGQINGIGLVMEYVGKGSLQGYLHIHKDKIKPQTLLKFAEDVAKGMEYLGQKKVVHRDLAARNILVESEKHVKISDFGLAHFVDENIDNEYYLLRTSRDLPIKWYAPECLQPHARFSWRSDVYSYGVTVFEMFSFGEDPSLEGQPDERGVQAQYEALKNNQRLACPPGEGTQEVYRALMIPCWKFNSKERPDFSKILRIINQLRQDVFQCEGF